MKMPDKIYVREYPAGVARFWEEKKKDDVVPTIPHEYIRKDALLEWAKEKLQERHAPQFRDALGQLIDKLNSL